MTISPTNSMELQIMNLLTDCRSYSLDTRNLAEKALNTIKEGNFNAYTQSLINILKNESVLVEKRFTAGVVLRNALNISLEFEFLKQNFETLNLTETFNKLLSVYGSNNQLNLVTNQILSNFLHLKIVLLNDKTVFNILENKSESVYCNLLNVLSLLGSVLDVELENLVQVYVKCFEGLNVKEINSKIENKDEIASNVSKNNIVVANIESLDCCLALINSFNTIYTRLNLHFSSFLTLITSKLTDILANNVLSKPILTSFALILAQNPFLTCLNALKTKLNSLFEIKKYNIEIFDIYEILSSQELKNNVILVSNENILLQNLFLYLKPDNEVSWSIHKAAVSCLKEVAKCTDLLKITEIRKFIWEKVFSSDEEEIQEGLMALGSLITKFNDEYFEDNAQHENQWENAINDLRSGNKDNSQNINCYDELRNNDYCINLVVFLQHCVLRILELINRSVNLSKACLWCLAKIFEEWPVALPAQNIAAAVTTALSRADQKDEDAITAALMLSSLFSGLREFEFKGTVLVQKLNSAIFLNNQIKSGLYEDLKDLDKGFYKKDSFDDQSTNLQSKPTSFNENNDSVEPKNGNQINEHPVKFDEISIKNLKNPSTLRDLQPIFTDIAGTLVTLCDSSECDTDIRSALFTALADFSITASPENQNVSLKIFSWYLQNLIQVNSQISSTSTDAFTILEEIITNYLSILQNIYTYLGENTIGFSNKKQFFDITKEILSINKPTTLFADCYFIISKLCFKNSYFAMHIDQFLPFILRDLESNDTYTIKSCLFFISDIANCLLVAFIPIANILMPKLIYLLKQNNLDKMLKPLIINTIADIALALGNSFDVYYNLCILFVTHIINLVEIDFHYLEMLTISILNLISSLFLAVNNNLLVYNLDTINKFLKKTIINVKSENVIVNVIKTMGDVLCTMGNLKETNWMYELLLKYARIEKFANVANEALMNADMH